MNQLRLFICYIVILFFSLTSCIDSNIKVNKRAVKFEGDSAIKVAIKNGYIKREIVLLKGKGRISIYLPPDLDTSYSFSEACNSPTIFRYAPKTYGKNNYNRDSDSIYLADFYQITSIDTKNQQVDSGLLKSEELIDRAINKEKYILTKFYLDTINSVKYVVKIYSDERKGRQHIEISAHTIVNKNFVSCRFANWKKDTNGSIDDMMISLHTLIIEK